ncbi:methicillin resistance protein [Stenotrophomonas humi]|uniref:Methicillin resistance protein n=1 Tax=Stenotrophomonas humi TaxID=405444 RepID=A0A0R0C1K0_9GAMM|nr:BlaI/MecI/CopY family transcriptional regulator [Stenotrophomonas humi]KRG63238.1 methicillin resistance protein [Stenotrophomonas humi]
MRRKTVGDQELALLQYIGENEPTSVGEVAARYGESRGLARSTVLTMMERLRTKGYLQRASHEGVYRYHTTAEQQEVVNSAVSSFVEKTLQGSISPFVAWMSEKAAVSDNELAELEALVARLQSQRRED